MARFGRRLHYSPISLATVGDGRTSVRSDDPGGPWKPQHSPDRGPATDRCVDRPRNGARGSPGGPADGRSAGVCAADVRPSGAGEPEGEKVPAGGPEGKKWPAGGPEGKSSQPSGLMDLLGCCRGAGGRRGADRPVEPAGRGSVRLHRRGGARAVRGAAARPRRALGPGDQEVRRGHGDRQELGRHVPRPAQGRHRTAGGAAQYAAAGRPRRLLCPRDSPPTHRRCARWSGMSPCPPG